MQQADEATTRSAFGGSSGKTEKVSIRILDPMQELADILGYSEIVGSLVACARDEIENLNKGQYYVPPGGRPCLKRLDHLLMAIELVHEVEMRRAENVEIGLYERGVPALMQRLAA